MLSPSTEFSQNWPIWRIFEAIIIKSFNNWLLWRGKMYKHIGNSLFCGRDVKNLLRKLTRHLQIRLSLFSMHILAKKKLENEKWLNPPPHSNTTRHFFLVDKKVTFISKSPHPPIPNIPNKYYALIWLGLRFNKKHFTVYQRKCPEHEVTHDIF